MLCFLISSKATSGSAQDPQVFNRLAQGAGMLHGRRRGGRGPRHPNRQQLQKSRRRRRDLNSGSCRLSFWLFSFRAGRESCPVTGRMSGPQCVICAEHYQRSGHSEPPRLLFVCYLHADTACVKCSGLCSQQTLPRYLPENLSLDILSKTA